MRHHRSWILAESKVDDRDRAERLIKLQFYETMVEDLGTRLFLRNSIS